MSHGFLQEKSDPWGWGSVHTEKGSCVSHGRKSALDEEVPKRDSVQQSTNGSSYHTLPTDLRQYSLLWSRQVSFRSRRPSFPVRSLMTTGGLTKAYCYPWSRTVENKTRTSTRSECRVYSAPLKFSVVRETNPPIVSFKTSLSFWSFVEGFHRRLCQTEGRT